MRKLFRNGISSNLILALMEINRRSQKFLAIILLIGILVGMLPQMPKAVAISEFPQSEEQQEQQEQPGEDESPSYPTTTDANADFSDVLLLHEVESFRTETTKTFQRADGTYVLAMYGDVIHFQEAGKWKDIDNSLVFESKSETYTNRANHFYIQFPNRLQSSDQIKMTLGQYAINWSIQGISRSSIQFETAQRQTEDMRELTSITQEVLYPSVLENVDVQYVVTGTKVKENIILHRYIKDFSLSFDYAMENLQLVVQEGEYLFLNEKGETVFSFIDLYAIDAAGEVTYDVKVHVEILDKSRFVLTLSVDDSWLRNAKFPVMIDPTISSPSRISIFDTFLSPQNNPSTTPLEFDNGNNKIAYLNFTVPNYLKDFHITYANLTVFRDTGSSTVLLRELPNYVNLSGLTWIDKPTALSQIVDFAVFSSLYSEYTFDITSSVQNWNKQGLTSMPGFEIRNKTPGLMKIHSMEATTSSRPKIEIGFIDSDGLKDYWTYNSYNAGPAGTAYVSDYTQKLTIVREDIRFATDLQSLAVSFALSNDRTQSNSPNIGYGNGWNTSYNLRLLYNNVSDEIYYTLDYTGNRVHYFNHTCDSRWVNDDDNDYVCYIAEDGSGNVLVRHVIVSLFQLELFIISPQDTKLLFSNNYLSQIEDLKTGLTITISRNQSARNKITNLTDTKGNEIIFSYNGNGNLASLELKTKGIASAMHSLKKVYFEYLPNTSLLHKVYYLTDYDQNQDLTLNLSDLSNVDQIVMYEYHSNGLAATASTHYLGFEKNSQDVLQFVDRLGEKLKFFYHTLNNRAISRIESYFDNTKIAEVNYDLESNQTKITDHSGNFVLYSFDRYGHTVNLLDKHGNAQYIAYLDIFINGNQNEPNYLLNHKVIYESSPAKATFSPIQNPGFENGITAWTMSNCNWLSTCISSTEQKITGAKSLKLKSNITSNHVTATQNVVLEKGIYTLSIDVRTQGATSGQVVIEFGNQSKTIPLNQNWTNHILTLPSLSPNNPVSIKLRSSSTSAVFFDNIQWYEDNQKERTNLIDNPSFERGGIYNWSTSSGATANLYTINSGGGSYDNTYQNVLGSHAVGLQNGRISTKITRDQFTSTGFGTIYISGWAHKYSAPSVNNANIENGKLFRMFIIQLDSNDQEIANGAIALNFNLSYTNWQYVFGEIDLKQNTATVVVGFDYLGEGEVLFDGMSVFFKSTEKRCFYDDKGRITSIAYPNNKTHNYIYQEGSNIHIPTAINEVVTGTTEPILQTVSITNDGSKITGVTKNNVKAAPSYNSIGQLTSYSLKTGDDSFTYFSTSTTYTHNSQYKSATTNEFGNTTTYYTNVINGLMTHIENSKGVHTQFEYYDNGVLSRVAIANSTTNEESSVVYVYNAMNQLVEIQLAESSYSYKIGYDPLGRMAIVKVNEQTLVSYTYYVTSGGIPTNQIETQTYGNGDSFKYIYKTDTNLVIQVLFKASGSTSYTLRVVYDYDNNDRMIKYTNLYNGLLESYEYEISGKLSEVKYSSGDYISYLYDEDGNLKQMNSSISSSFVSTKYYKSSALDPNLHDRTEFTFASNGHLTVRTSYGSISTPDPLLRVLGVHYQFQDYPEGNLTVDYDYYNYTARIKKITVDTRSTTTLKKIQYEYTYDNLGNVTEEKYREMAQGSSVFVDIITRKYIYDDLNQLIQESVHNSQVDCNNTSNIHACYLKIYEYDKLGNLIRQKTLKYLNTNNLVKVTTSTPYSNGDMIFKYNGLSQYYTPYVIPVGGSINLSFSFYDITEFPPELITSPVSVTLNTSNVDTSSPGIYLLTGTAYASGYGYTLQFGIIVNVGNIVVVNQVNYSYTNAWKDQLSSYTVVTNGVSKTSAITYDNQGNPTVITNFLYGGTKHNHANLKWEGRQLVNIKVYSSSNDTVKVGEIWYSYNDQGIRVRKTIDSNGDGITNLKYDYIMVGDQLLAEIVFEKVSGIWEEIYQIHYLYEHDGSAIGFQYFTPSSSPSTYLYIRNIQGDVTKIVDPDGYVVVRYEYDAYGNILSMTGSHANTLGKHNSLTYRSYKYDREINLYYLNSRYYNPEIGRFISSDGLLGPVGNILGHNMYSYTQNNPVMFVDPSGNYPIFLFMFLFTYMGGTLTQIATSIVAYMTMAVVAVADVLIGDGKGAWADMNEINWNPFNDNENKVIGSSYISFYKGVPVVRVSEMGGSLSLGIIWFDRTGDSGVLKHERGHNSQLMGMGLGNYLIQIGIPSLWKNGAETPWELSASILGGSNQVDNYSQNQIAQANLYYKRSSVPIVNILNIIKYVFY